MVCAFIEIKIKRNNRFLYCLTKDSIHGNLTKNLHRITQIKIILLWKNLQSLRTSYLFILSKSSSLKEWVDPKCTSSSKSDTTSLSGKSSSWMATPPISNAIKTHVILPLFSRTHCRRSSRKNQTTTRRRTRSRYFGSNL